MPKIDLPVSFPPNAEPQDSYPKELKVRRDGKVLTFMLSPGKIGIQLRNQGIPSSTPATGKPAP